MTLLLDDLDLLAPGGAPDTGAPMRLPITLIDEDPDQPRQAFDDASLAELATTIGERGVRQPVSVRTHPQQPGRWMLNFGARRLRASKLAGLSEIPAFVDETAQSVDQFIENEQRKGLTPLEIALFVGRALKAGQTQAEIARSIGKSRQYVMTATALIEPPEWLMTAYRAGRCRGLHELHEWRKLYAAYPQQLVALTADDRPLTRERAALVRADLEQRALATAPAVSDTTASEPADLVPASLQPEEQIRTPAPAITGLVEPSLGPAQPLADPVARPSRAQTLTHAPKCLLARLDTQTVRVLTQAIPEEEGHVFVQALDTDVPQTVEAQRLVLIGFDRG